METTYHPHNHSKTNNEHEHEHYASYHAWGGLIADVALNFTPCCISNTTTYLTPIFAAQDCHQSNEYFSTPSFFFLYNYIKFLTSIYVGVHAFLLGSVLHLPLLCPVFKLTYLIVAMLYTDDDTWNNQWNTGFLKQSPVKQSTFIIICLPWTILWNI